MHMKISSIQIKCKKKNIFIQLSNKISFIYGNAGVGKTTLLNLICYGLGNNLVKTLAIEQEVLGICLNVLINGEVVCLERKMNSNCITLTRNNEKVSLIAKNSKDVYGMTFSDFLYLMQNIEPIEMLRRKSSKEIKVNFSNFMWFSYLRQEELDNTLFYLGDQNNSYKEFASNYVMKVLLGEKEVSNKEINKEINKLKEKQENTKFRLSVMRDMCSVSKVFNANLSQEIAKKQKEIIHLNKEIEGCKDELLKEGIIDNIFLNNLMEKQRRIGKYEAEVRYLIEFGKINEIKQRYLYDLNQYENKMRYYEDRKNSTDNKVFENNLKKLEQIFFECLLGVGFSHIEPTDYVKISNKNFIPSIYSRNDVFRFDYYNLSSGGKKTIFKICYALAIHIYVIENNIQSLLPRFIFIDTPMKNISEREDKVLYENLYRFFMKLFTNGGKLESVQLIIVDKEFPQVLKGERVMLKHMTNEEPLLPYLKE